MANYKRKKSKRSVRCTMCSQNQWKGNSADRVSFREHKNRVKAREELKDGG